MLTMTEAAGGYLSKVLSDISADPGTAVRLVAEPQGVKTGLDRPRPGDRSFAHEGRKVLVVDEQTSQALSGRTLDVESTPDGTKLSIG